MACGADSTSMRTCLTMPVAVLLVLGWLATPATACRCAPRSLAQYFADAELVFIGRVLTAEAGEAHRDVRFAVQGKPFKGDPATVDGFRTALSSATCGYAVEPGRTYLIFASRRAPAERVAWFDTCNGSRAFDPHAPPGIEPFSDTPAAE